MSLCPARACPTGHRFGVLMGHVMKMTPGMVGRRESRTTKLRTEGYARMALS